MGYIGGVVISICRFRWVSQETATPFAPVCLNSELQIFIFALKYFTSDLKFRVKVPSPPSVN